MQIRPTSALIPDSLFNVVCKRRPFERQSWLVRATDFAANATGHFPNSPARPVLRRLACLRFSRTRRVTSFPIYNLLREKNVEHD